MARERRSDLIAHLHSEQLNELVARLAAKLVRESIALFIVWVSSGRRL